MRIKLSKLTDTAKTPTRSHDEDAGHDLYADEGVTLGPGETYPVSTGLAIEVPHGYGGFVLPRSGLAAKQSLTVLNAPGLIDPGYTGEVKIILHNADNFYARSVSKGERVAQLVVQKIEYLDFVEVDHLKSSSGRGKGGFGSTGVNSVPPVPENSMHDLYDNVLDH